MKASNISLLYVEDNIHDQAAFKRFASRCDMGMSYDVVSSVSEAIEKLKSGKFNIVLADYILDDGNAITILKRFKDVPLIMVTWQGNEEISAKAIKLGAYDYLIKDFECNYLQRLPVMIERAISYRKLELESKNYYKDLEERVNERTKELVQEITKGQLTRRKLHESEMRFEELAENISEVFRITSIDLKKIYYVSPAYQAIWGHSCESLYGRPLSWVDSIHVDDRDKVINAIKKAVKDKSEFLEEYRILRPDGSIRWIIDHIVFIKTVSEFTDHSIAIAEDISERKASNDRVLKLSQIIDCSPASVVVTDTEGHIEYVNQQFTSITGYTFKEVIGKNPRILKSGTLPHDYYIRLWATISAGYPWNGRFHNKKKNGELYWEYQSISPIKDENGKIINYVAIKIDDTERIRAEEEARKNEQRLANILELSQDAIISIDEYHNVIIFNKGAEFVFDYVKAEVSGKPINMLFAEKSKNIINKYLKTICKSQLEMGILRDNNELFGCRRNNEEFPVEVSVSKFKEDDQLILTLILRDITERKKMEAEVLKAEKLKSLGVLAGGIAHDFNNLLALIRGNTNLAMLEVKAGDKIYDILVKVEKASMQASGLTEQLVSFTKHGTPIKKTTSISELVKDSTDIILPGSNVKGKLFIEEDLWSVDVDVGQINQVITNLVINAQQAMCKGGLLEIRAENVITSIPKETTLIKKEKYVKLSFKDNGAGIPRDILPKIFDPYFTTKKNGTGLGLASSYSIIKDHNGLMEVDSVLGEGTIFSVYLPASLK